MDKWNSSTVYPYSCAGYGYQKFDAFCKFISTEATKACHPISSCSAVIALNKRPAGELKRKEVKVGTATKVGVKSFATNATGAESILNLLFHFRLLFYLFI